MLLFIENVGNLVCPAAADLMLLNKSDLLPHLAFDVAPSAAKRARF
jgi:Ni2+-binding GTPase involved in maturation of urease and hydrogenase